MTAVLALLVVSATTVLTTISLTRRRHALHPGGHAGEPTVRVTY
jgi:hypothetical protein